MARSLSERFWGKVEVTPECWIWLGQLNNHGYGLFRAGSHSNAPKRAAHRIAYELTHGAVSAALDVMHSCDVPCCVNPRHLAPGTRARNISDSLKRGRHPAAVGHPGHAQWKKNVRASRQCLLEGKEEEIRTKRAAGRSINSLAKEYDVDWSVAARITRGLGTDRKKIDS